jgi:metal-responsive CopG/Arc/MetJ family transcriptional regulator
MVEAIDTYRYANRIPSRSEAIRKLVELGLKAKGK